MSYTYNLVYGNLSDAMDKADELAEMRDERVLDNANYLLSEWRNFEKAQNAVVHSEVLSELLTELVHYTANNLQDPAAIGRLMIEAVKAEAKRIAEYHTK